MTIEEAQADAGDHTVYAVWIRGKGWLKQDDTKGDTTLAALNKAVAESAARLWGKDAQVLPFDQSLLDLETKFLAREHELNTRTRVRGWLKQHGILG